MTWKSFHRRGEILRTVQAVADERRDGRLPMDVPGVPETFGDELSLLTTLQLRWHTRLAGRIERELMGQPLDLEAAVARAWSATAEEMPGVRLLLDEHIAHPRDDAMARAMAVATAKERAMLAVMSGRVSAADDTAIRIGAAIEERARREHAARPHVTDVPRPSLRDRLRAALVA